jgi:TolB-like protein/Tfp pilus assembly protein PilF
VIGQTLGRYQILAKLGEGGMGEVFRATDTKLGRVVALKVLPRAMARDPERLARFEREARAVAALNHPHIVTLYSVEEADDINFLTMELVEGQSLAELIPERGLPLDQILTAGSALADALAAAHDKGIVHRDLKPANVMLTADGRVKVLDFGLAKEMRPAPRADATMTAAGHTEVGMVMGTPAYMSPEQLAGRVVDHRTDIFSLGILLYQMSSGHRPFEGATSIELASAILRDTPRPLGDIRSDLPDDLVRLIRRCLEKDPQRRVQTARDVGNEVREVARAAAAGARRPASGGSAASRAHEGFWIAVLPFKYTGSNADLTALAEGLSEETVTGLSRFSYLRVIARASTVKYSSESRDVNAIGHELGARYVLEGSVRQAGSTVRVAARLVDAGTGAHLWAETYDRRFQPDQVFALQDELVPRIVSTCGDHFGVLARSISEAVRSKVAAALTPYEALMRGFGYHHRLSPAEHADARDVLERAVEAAPANADCWAMLSWIYSHEYGHGFNPRPGSLDRALAAARRAVDLAPSNHLAYQTLAVALFFRRERAACSGACERALALNPLDGSNEAIFLITFMGDWDRGCSLIRRAMELNPHHPGWYRAMLGFDEYRKANYRAAIDEVVKANVPGIFWSNVLTAAAHGQLGDRVAARAALGDLLAQKPDFAQSAPELMGRWFDPRIVEHLTEGLRQAGLELPSASTPGFSTAIDTKRPADSGAVRADEGFWVAVLPFKYAGADADVDALAEGLSEEIVTGLSRFSYLRVIARGSTSQYAGTAADVRTVAREIGARYVMEGSVRQAGSQLRVAVQLVDAMTGAHLWAETYNRALQPGGIFDLQDDLVPRIVSTVADANGVLPRSMGDSLRGRGAGNLTPYEAVLRGWSFYSRITPEEHAEVRQILEHAVDQAKDNADAWGLLSLLYQDEHRHGFNRRPGSLDRALAAARRAVELAPSSHFAYHALASVLFFRRDLQGFRSAAERTIALNTMDGATVTYVGALLAFAGDWPRGCELVERGLPLNPHRPGWVWLPLFYNAYRRRDYAGALDLAVKINMPGYFFAQAALAMAHAQLDHMDDARDAVRQLLLVKPDIARTARAEFATWFVESDLLDHVCEGLRKAGLDVGAAERRAPPDSAAVRTAASAALSPPSVAVLPFANLSADKDQEYFSDGLAEEIINLLAQVPGLKVISRTSAFAFRGKDEDIRKIAQALDVTHVLSGSVRRAGARIRVTTQLIAAADGGHVWSERYDRELSDIFAVQDEISGAITGALRVKLSGEATPERYKPKLPAYEAYLKGRHHLAKVTPESMELARRCYESAIELDPEFGLAHVGIGFYWLTLTIFGGCPAREAVPAARAAIQRAMQTDRSIPEAHALLGFLTALYDLDWAVAERQFEFPMARQAGFAIIRPLYGGLQFFRGNYEAAIELAERAIEEDPLEVWPRMNLHAYLQAVGRDRESYEHAMKVLELDPNLVVARMSIAHFHADWGQLPEALAAARQGYATAPWYPDATATLAALLKRSGEEAESRALYESLGSGEDAGSVRARALYYLLCGEIDDAADCVEKGIELRDNSTMYYLRFVISKPLRASARWPRIARLLNLPA